MKFKPKVIGEPRIFLVGECPGRQYFKKTGVVWEGNKSGDLMQRIIKGKRNLFLTNLTNYQNPTDDEVITGLHDLLLAFVRFHPKKIICFGVKATKTLQSWSSLCKIVSFKHPSYIIRFNKNKELYIKEVQNELSK